jgi:hypothetical protein
LQYVTLFSCDTFGFYVAWTYIQYGIQVTTRQFDESTSTPPGAYVSIILSLLMLVTAFLFKILSRSALFHRHVRRFCADYGMPLALIASSAMAYWGRFHTAGPQTLPVGAAFKPANGRSWLVPFWQLEGKWVALALPFGFILWILFFFDHNVSVRRPFLFFLSSKFDERGYFGSFAVADLTGIPVSAPKACWLSL